MHWIKIKTIPGERFGRHKWVESKQSGKYVSLWNLTIIYPKPDSRLSNIKRAE